MESLNRFIEEYEKLKILYPQLYVSINEARQGNFWRIKVFAHDLAIIGDAELLSVEDENRDTAFNRATAKLIQIPTQILNAMEIKRSGRQIHVKKR